MRLAVTRWYALVLLADVGCVLPGVGERLDVVTDLGPLDPNIVPPPAPSIQRPMGPLRYGVVTLQGMAHRGSQIIIQSPRFNPLACMLNPSSENYCADVPLPRAGTYEFTLTSITSNGVSSVPTKMKFVYNPAQSFGQQMPTCEGGSAEHFGGMARCGPAP